MPSSRGTNKGGRILRDYLAAGHHIVLRRRGAVDEPVVILAEMCYVEPDGEHEVVVREAEGIGPQAALEELSRKLLA